MTGKEKILNVMEDGQWHSYYELLSAYYKFTQRIFDLRRSGYVIEERPNFSNKHAKDYRLVKEPDQNEGRAKPKFTLLDGKKMPNINTDPKPREKELF